MSIKPTVGRVLWFFPDPKKEDEVHAAIIAGVNDDGTLNLAVFDSQGHQYSQRNIPLIQENPDEDPKTAFAVWVPITRAVGQPGGQSVSDAILLRLCEMESTISSLCDEVAQLQDRLNTPVETPPPVSNDHVAPGCEQFQTSDTSADDGQQNGEPATYPGNQGPVAEGDGTPTPAPSDSDSGDAQQESGDAGGAPADTAGEQGQGG